MDGGRRYTDREFALILRKALELDDRALPAPGRTEGMTLAEMQAVAREVGLDPAAVARAASLLPATEPGRVERILGGPAHVRAEHRASRRLSPEEMGRVISGIRRKLDHQGEVTEELDAVTWKSVGQTSTPFVTLRPDGDGTEIQIHHDRSGAIVLTWLFTTLGLAFVGAALGSTLAPSGAVGGLLYLSGFVAAGAATARLLWTRSSAAATARLHDLLGHVTAGVESAGGSSPPDAPSADPD